MRSVFKAVKHRHRSDPKAVVEIYGRRLWDSAAETWYTKNAVQVVLYVGLLTGHSKDFEQSPSELSL
jgi:hypothetical protein